MATKANPPQKQPDIVNDDIFTLMSIPNASDEEKQKMTASMMQTIQARVLARMIDLFDTPEERKKVNAAFDANDMATVNSMLATKGMPEFLALVAQEVLLYKQEALQLVQSSTN